MILEIDAVIPEDRKLLVELPPEFPVGPQRLFISSNGQPEQKRYEIHPSMVPEREAFYRLLPELLRDHPEQFVAIKGGKVIAIAPTELGVLREGSKLVSGSVYVRRIALSEKPERLRRYREVREALSHRFPYYQDGSQPYPGLELVLSTPENPEFEIRIAAKVDCGADRTIVPASLIDDLQMVEIETKQFVGVDGHIFSMPLFILHVQIADLPKCEIVAAANDEEPVVLLGLDVLNQLRITLDGPNQILEIG